MENLFLFEKMLLYFTYQWKYIYHSCRTFLKVLINSWKISLSGPNVIWNDVRWHSNWNVAYYYLDWLDYTTKICSFAVTRTLEIITRANINPWILFSDQFFHIVPSISLKYISWLILNRVKRTLKNRKEKKFINEIQLIYKFILIDSLGR